MLVMFPDLNMYLGEHNINITEMKIKPKLQ